MYKVYLDKQLIHDLDSEDNVLVNPTLNLELNKAGTFEFSMECTHPFYDKMERFKSIVQVLCDGDEIFKGRIIEITDDMYKERTVYCESELAYLNDSIQRPYEYHLAANAVVEYLTAVIGSHNGQVEDAKQFTVGMVTITDPNDYIYCYTNYNPTMDEIKEDLVDDLGGYIRIRNDYKNNDPLGELNVTSLSNGRFIDYIKLEEYGNTSTQYIQFGENLLDFSNDINQADICTGIIPLGATLEESEYSAIEERVTIESVNDGSDYLVIPEAVEKYGLILKVVTWDDITDPGNLKTAAEQYLAEYDYEPQTITATAVDMHLTDEEIMSWRLGDMIFVESEPHDLHKRFPLASMSIPLDQPENTTVTLGTYEDTSLSARTNKTESGLRNFEDFSTGNIIASAVAQATNILNGAIHGYVTLNLDDDGHPYELLIMDTESTDTATKVWRWNMGGLGYSSTGYDKADSAYTTAITMDGHILGTLIIANGMILADDKDVEFAKFDDTGMKIYAQSGRDDLMLMTIGRTGMNIYDDTGKDILASFNPSGVQVYNGGLLSSSLFANGMTFYNSNGDQVILRLFQQGLMVNDDDGNTLVTLTPSGETFYYNGDNVGNIGTGYWTGYPNNRGLGFHLENSASFMTFGWRETSSASEYTAMIAYHTSNSSEVQGVHIGDTLFLRGNKLYFGEKETSGYVQLENNGGALFDGAQWFFQNCTLWYGSNSNTCYEVLTTNSKATVTLSNGTHGSAELEYYVAGNWTLNIAGLFSDYALSSAIPTNVSQLNNDANYAATSQIPTKVSQLENDAGYLTSATAGSGFEDATLNLTNSEQSMYVTVGGTIKSGGTTEIDIGPLFGEMRFEDCELIIGIKNASGTFYGTGGTITSGGSCEIDLSDVIPLMTVGYALILTDGEGGSIAYVDGNGKYFYLGDGNIETQIYGSSISMDISSSSGKITIGTSYSPVYIKGQEYTVSGSDERLKTAIEPLEETGLDNLKPVSFKWKDGDDRKHYGYIAQQVQEHIPELVHEGTDGMLGLAYTEIIPLLHMEIKALKEEIAQLKKGAA